MSVALNEKKQNFEKKKDRANLESNFNLGSFFLPFKSTFLDNFLGTF